MLLKIIILKMSSKPTDNFVIRSKFQTITAIDSTLSGEINLPGTVAYDPNSAVNIAAE